MPVQLGQVIKVQFPTQSVAGVSMNADFLPTAVLVRNGDDSVEVVTVENKSTGVYKASFTIPLTWALQDIVEVRAQATVGTIAGKAMIWSNVIEAVARAGAGSATAILTIKDTGGAAIADCEVWITTDAAGTKFAAGTLETGADGKVSFWLDPGTYYRWAQKTGKNFTNPQSFVVT